MTKMAATSINGLNFQNSSPKPVNRLPRNRLHWGPGHIIVCSHEDHGTTMTYFKARSKLVVCVFEWGKLLNGLFTRKILQQMLNLTLMVVCPWPGYIYMYMTIIFKHLLLEN